LPYIVNEWLNLAIRWTHVFAGIMWIGQTYFFTWLDLRLHEEKDVWMVHSGGFYIVNKHGLEALRSQKLHWFKYEALTTLLTGHALFVLVYYMGGLISGRLIWISLGMMVLAWFVYDLLWTSPLSKNQPAAVVVSYLLLLGYIYGAFRLFDGRPAYMQVGATMGTLMAVNVWARILPNQARLIAQAAAGQQPDIALAEVAKQRSKQNTFMVVPVVLIMISNHFPVATYGNTYNWIILAVLVLVGWGIASIIRKR
jgi:uncharacterized membrane protein